MKGTKSLTTVKTPSRVNTWGSFHDSSLESLVLAELQDPHLNLSSPGVSISLDGGGDDPHDVLPNEGEPRSDHSDKSDNNASSVVFGLSGRQENPQSHSNNAEPRSGLTPDALEQLQQEIQLTEAFRIPDVTKNKLEATVARKNGQETSNRRRDLQRGQILEHVKGMTHSSHDNRELPEEELHLRLLKLATRYQSKSHLELNRFERLCLLSILHAQHRLTVLDEEIEHVYHGDLTGGVFDKLQTALEEYSRALQTYQYLRSQKQPGLKASRLTGISLASELNEPHYWDSPDALNLFEIKPHSKEATVDRLRLALQNIFPERFLDKDGRERRRLDRIDSSLKDKAANLPNVTKSSWISNLIASLKTGVRPPTSPPRSNRGPDDIEQAAAGSEAPGHNAAHGVTAAVENKNDGMGEITAVGEDKFVEKKKVNFTKAHPGAGTSKIIQAYRRRPRHISPIVDTTARLIVASFGGLLLLVPMVVLCYVTAFKWVLIVTFLFVISFSVALSVVSRASNDQIMAATAAYGAVLVVFIANLLPKTTPTT